MKRFILFFIVLVFLGYLLNLRGGVLLSQIPTKAGDLFFSCKIACASDASDDAQEALDKAEEAIDKAQEALDEAEDARDQAEQALDEAKD